MRQAYDYWQDQPDKARCARTHFRGNAGAGGPLGATPGMGTEALCTLLETGDRPLPAGAQPMRHLSFRNPPRASSRGGKRHVFRPRCCIEAVCSAMRCDIGTRTVRRLVPGVRNKPSSRPTRWLTRSSWSQERAVKRQRVASLAAARAPSLPAFLANIPTAKPPAAQLAGTGS